MCGPGAAASKFGALAHLVLIMKLRDGLSELDAHTAIQAAEFQVARRAAETTLGVEPIGVEVYDLRVRRPELPNVVLIQGCLTDDHHVHSGVSYYGLPIRESLSTVESDSPICENRINYS